MERQNKHLTDRKNKPRVVIYKLTVGKNGIISKILIQGL